MSTEFKNEPLTDFSQPDNRKAQEEALKKVAASFGKTYPLIIGGKEVTTGKIFDSINPSRKEEVIGHFHGATAKEVQAAIQAGEEAFATWSRVPAAERADLLFAAVRAQRLDDPGGGEELGRGRRRHRGGDRLPRLLRPGGDPLRRRPSPDAAAGGEEPAGVPASGRRRGDPAVELPPGDPRGHGDGGGGGREHGRPQAVERRAGNRLPVHEGDAGCRHAAGCDQLPARPGSRYRRRPGLPPAHSFGSSA